MEILGDYFLKKMFIFLKYKLNMESKIKIEILMMISIHLCSVRTKPELTRF